LKELTIKAHAKINLGLYITGKRDNGFHELCSIFLPVELHDTMHIKMDEGLSTLRIRVSGPYADQCPSDEKNIVFKAYNKLRALKNGVPLGLDLQIEKNIPAEAGLGGGSSDAAAFLVALNTMWGLHLPMDELKAIGATLGADVPFFIDSKPALVKGIGDIIRPFELKRDYWAVIAKPRKGLSTAQVYKEFTLDLTLKTRNAKHSELLESLSFQGLNKAEELGPLSNDLERVSSAVLPEIRDVRDSLEKMRPIVCMMSGSGSAVFALFDKEPELEFQAEEPTWFFCTTKVMRG